MGRAGRPAPLGTGRFGVLGGGLGGSRLPKMIRGAGGGAAGLASPLLGAVKGLLRAGGGGGRPPSPPPPAPRRDTERARGAAGSASPGETPQMLAWGFPSFPELFRVGFGAGFPATAMGRQSHRIQLEVENNVVRRREMRRRMLLGLSRSCAVVPG